jgi:hypothetical protein
MSSLVPKCPLCSQDADIRLDSVIDRNTAIYNGSCQTCKYVRVTQTVVNDLRAANRRHLLSAFFRHFQGQPPLVSTENVDSLLADMPSLRTVPEKMNGLLRHLADPKYPPGTGVEFSFQRDYPLIFGANWEEANYLIGQLSVRKFILPITGTNRYQVTADGYERLEQLEATSYKSSRNAFVAMWFDPSWDFIYNEAIKPAIREAGYQEVRIDRTEHVNRIDDEIISQIRQSRFLVADFTGQREGVYYEAGFMHGLGRNVFFLVERKQLEEVHFDVRQYNFIAYESPPDAKKRLYDRIMAVEGKGPGPIA